MVSIFLSRFKPRDRNRGSSGNGQTITDGGTINPLSGQFVAGTFTAEATSKLQNVTTNTDFAGSSRGEGSLRKAPSSDLTTIPISEQVPRMGNWERASTAKQLAVHLCEEISHGRWHGKMPGVIKLASELGVSRNSVEAALVDLEQKGILRSQGRGKKRTIATEGTVRSKRALQVAILLYEAPDAQIHYVVELRHLLNDAGHYATIAPRCLSDLQMNVPRIAKLVAKTEADAWVVMGASREVLEWFAAQSIPALALFGRASAMQIAAVGPDHLTALIEVTRKLIQLGHRRIVMLTRPERRTPKPGFLERAVLAEMESHGIQVGPYNLPDWEVSIEGLHQGLDQLFRFTPPTALLIDEAFIFAATQQHLARQGILAPQHVSLVCCDHDPIFAWFDPPVTYMRWDSRQMLRNIVRWVAGVARGQNLRRKVYTEAELVEGGTIGLAWLAGKQARQPDTIPPFQLPQH